jgi:hypothetical protein
MDKKRYCVSVQSRLISEVSDDSNYPLEILATTQELSELNRLLSSETDADEAGFIHMPVTALSSKPEVITQKYDVNLIRIYHTIYQLGTLKTKEFIKSMKIID